jgi:hypothetical protein
VSEFTHLYDKLYITIRESPQKDGWLVHLTPVDELQFTLIDSNTQQPITFVEPEPDEPEPEPEPDLDTEYTLTDLTGGT